MSQAIIGIIDSGLGGLAIALSIWDRLPQESTIYLADHAFFPYGDKTAKELNKRLVTLANFLLAKPIKVLVVACNTATVTSIDFLRQIFPFPIIGVEPAVKPLLADHNKENIVALVTPNTARGGFYGSEQVRVHPCPGLAEEIEEYAQQPRQLKQAVKQVLNKINQPYSALVLGCTHYLLVKETFAELAPENVIILDPSEAVAAQTAKVLEQDQKLNNKGEPERLFLTTGDAKEVSGAAGSLLKQSIMFSACSL